MSTRIKSFKINLKQLLVVFVVLVFFTNAAQVSAVVNLYCQRHNVTDAAKCETFLKQSGIYFVGAEADAKKALCITTTIINSESALAPGSKIYVLGDSITNQSRAEVTAQITAAGYSIAAINADPARAISKDTVGSSPSGLQAITDDSEIIRISGAIVIALGTNSGTEDLNVQIPALMAKIREELNVAVPVFWVNVFSTSGSTPARNEKIKTFSTATYPYTVIDTTAANIQLDSKGTHPTVAGNTTFAQTVAAGLKNYGGIEPATAGGYSPISLSYPAFPSDTEIASKITDYLKTKYPNSPWHSVSLDFGSWIIKESKARNINPLLILAIGRQENGFGSGSQAHVTKYFNYFGMKGNGPVTVPNSEYRGFASPTAGITFFLDTVQKNTQSTDRGRYAAVNNFYEYLAMHQSGLIAYPGDLLDPTDRSGPVFSGGAWVKNGNKPDGDRLNGYDPSMGVYTSWEPILHPNPRYNLGAVPNQTPNPNSVYNPGNYYKPSIALINLLTEQSLSDTPGKGSAQSSCTGAEGVPMPHGANGYDLKDTGPNPLVMYSQNSTGTDAAVSGYFGATTYGTGNIGDCGCGPTSFATIVTTITGKKVEPPEVAKWAAENGYQQDDCGSSWWWVDNAQKTKERWGVVAEDLQKDFARAKTALSEGKLVILSAGGGNLFVSGTTAADGHIFVMRAFTADGKFLFADPSADGDKKSRPAFGPLFDVNRAPIAEADIATSLKGMWAMGVAVQ